MAHTTYPAPGEAVELTITSQGSVLIEQANCRQISEYLVAIDLECRSKYAQFGSYSTGMDTSQPALLQVVADDNTLHLAEGKERWEATEFFFPQFPGWTVYAVMEGRYFMHICLIRK